MSDTDKYYKVADMPGVAWYTLGPVKVRDEDYEWTGIETDDENMVQMVMVGDDRVHHVDKADLTEIDEDEFCHGCGQIGCGH